MPKSFLDWLTDPSATYSHIEALIFLIIGIFSGDIRNFIVSKFKKSRGEYEERLRLWRERYWHDLQVFHDEPSTFLAWIVVTIGQGLLNGAVVASVFLFLELAARKFLAVNYFLIVPGLFLAVGVFWSKVKEIYRASEHLRNYETSIKWFKEATAIRLENSAPESVDKAKG